MGGGEGGREKEREGRERERGGEREREREREREINECMACHCTLTTLYYLNHYIINFFTHRKSYVIIAITIRSHTRHDRNFSSGHKGERI